MSIFKETPMEEFRDYDIRFPELVYDIVDYFRISNRVKEPAQKSVLDYCNNSRFNIPAPNREFIQPDTVHKICELLTKNRVLICTRVGTSTEGFDSNYLFMPRNEDGFLQKHPAVVFRFNCLVYGFRFIYSTYREFVLPVIVKKDGDISMGTCFRFHSGILTAKHCLDVDEVCIPGFSSEQLNNCQVLMSEKGDIDLAYIELNQPSILVSDDAHVLDEVLVMGYPKIPQFFDFCAAERATVSSIPTRGVVASMADQYLSKSAGQLMLVTARIRGGNSGGPIIGSNGAVVGVAFSEPMSKGDYDEMGYGIAYPIEVFYELLKNPLDMKVNFVDAIE